MAKNFYRKAETHNPAEGVTVKMLVVTIDGEDLDTDVHIEGVFSLSGKRRNEFIVKLGALINEYRISEEPND